MNWTAAEVDAVLLSLRVCTIAVLILLPLAVGTAWVLARTHFAGKILVEALINLPLVLPPVVTGYILLIVFGRNGWLGNLLFKYLNIQFTFDWTGAAIATAIVSFPLAVRAIRQSLESIDPRLDIVAQTLGASPQRRFLTITLPLAIPGIITGGLLAFARGLGEFGATITFVGNIPGETRTIPLAIYSAIQTPGGEAAGLRLVILSVILAVFAVAASELLGRRQPERIAR